MPDRFLILGDVVFDGSEVPEEIMLEAQPNRSAVGEDRVRAPSGSHPDHIKWRGCLAGASAQSRAKLVEVLAQSGAPTSLSCEGKIYQVVIAQFTPDYEPPTEVP